ncbi:hypothetical protein FQN53_005155 [Emmonsiellopsis sp. PD_33]|nr:hypothetical protein FQN53_005155 [Emmonsiellopsis sp. PD_33]
MGEKRKLPARGGESAAKRRVSEAAQRETTPARRKASATPVVVLSPEPEKVTLPTKIKDGVPLPTLPKPQPPNLSLQEYQSYAESAVLAAALQRSRVKWLNDCIFEKYWTKPSKKKSQPQPTFQNPPKESMSKLGPCSIVIEPHHFEAMLYTVRQPQTQQSIQYTAPQRPIVQYAPPNGFHQYHPHPPQNQPRPLPPYTPNSRNSPASTPPIQQRPPPQPIHNNPPSAPQPPQSRPEGSAPPPPQSHTPQPPPMRNHTQSHPPQNPPTHNPPQNHLPNQPPAQKPPEQPSQPVKTSPDPVIQMLATRAASNPDLKALMRVVASSKANQAQLRTFQAHIDELNAILASKNQQERQRNSPHVKPEPQQQPMPGPPTPSASTPTPPVLTRSPAPPNPSLPPHPPHTPHLNAPTPPPNVPSAVQPQARASPSSYSPYPQQPVGQPIRSKNPQQPPQNAYFHQHTPSQPLIQPAKPDPKAVVFEFLPPAAAHVSNNSSHATTGDRFLFPANTILDYFPGGTTVIASFLVIKKIDPSAPSPDIVGAAGGKAKSKKAKAASATANATPTDTPSRTPVPEQESASNLESKPGQSDKTTTKTTQPETPTTSDTKAVATPKPKIKEYYQPVTMRLHANNPRTLEPLARVVNPPNEVRQYMNDIMDRMERADIEYLALRLPREGTKNGADEEETGGDESRSVRGKSKGRGDENGVVVKQEGGAGLGDYAAEMFEDELKEFYDMPSGIVPLR